MKVSDFEIDWDSGCFTCCLDHVMNCDNEVEIGDTIECDHCGITMVLRSKNGKLMWSK